MNRNPREMFETVDLSPPRAGGEPLPTSFAAGRYQIRRLLGQGGQKQVYLAWDARLERQVVVYLLKTAELDQRTVGRLWQEAQTMALLGSHPNIVTVYDIGEECHRPFVVCEYIEGGSVQDRLEQAETHRLPATETLRIGEQLCQALTWAHARQIVHRDLKPANVWLTESGSVKLGDFGLAVGRDRPRISDEPSIVGTVAYMAPEQALGQPVGPHSDLYSLGAMLYELVTGRPPFLSDHLLGVISQHINVPPVAPSWHNPEVPQALETLILGLLAKVPAERPGSAAAVGEALAAIASSGLALSARVSPQDAKSLDRLAEGVFVGRDQELVALRAALNDLLAEHGGLLLLVGEPGSGKTRLAEQLATYARMRDVEVLFGRCNETEGAPAFWPWVQIIRAYVRERAPATLMGLMGHGAAEIAQLVPELRERLPDLPLPPPLEPEQARFRLFDSITVFLKNGARSKPLALILDDLHWADKPSLLLLQFLAAELREMGVLVIGTYRDTELGRQHPLAATLAELSRQGLSRRLALHGLARPNVRRFIELTAGVAPSDSLADLVCRVTDGNPFFVNEVVKLLVAEGRLDRPAAGIPIPEGVREVIGRRLDHLSEGCNRVLRMASVVGREFELSVLGTLSELPADEVLDLLEEAAAARIIREVPGQLGRYSFAHALMRETLYEELSTNRRVRLHRRTAEVMEQAYAARLETHLAELAHHFLQAAPGGPVDKAVAYAARAADRATGLLAYEEAAGYYERALEALEHAPDPDQAIRCELLLGLADAQTKAGNASEGWETFRRAAGTARSLGAAELFARAALGSGSWAVGVRYGRLDEQQVGLLAEALAMLGEGDSPLRAKLLAQMSLACYHVPGDARLALSQEALEMARRVGDPTAHLAALFARTISLEGYEKAGERLAVATEIVRIAERTQNKEMALRGHYRRVREFLELGDLAAVDAELETFGRLAEELRQPLYMWLTPFAKASRALLEGRFDDCQRLLEEALAIGRRAQDQNAPLFYATTIVALRRLQGRFSEVEPKIRDCVERYPSITGWRASLTTTLASLDRRAEARAEFERLADGDFAGLPRDGAWLVSVCLLANVCAYLRDGERARTLYDLLLPFAGHNIVTGNAPAFYGTVDRYLGMLAATLNRWGEASRHFEDSLAACARMRSRPFEAYTQHEYAAMLLARGRPEDRPRTAELLARALDTATELGMQKLVEDVRALQEHPQHQKHY